MSTEQRLRAAAKANRETPYAEEVAGCEELMEDAADEIKELRAENRVLRLAVRNLDAEQAATAAFKRGEYMTSEELLEIMKARGE